MFPGSEILQEQAQMQVILHAKSMLCPPNSAVIFQGFYMRCQSVPIINYNIKYSPIYILLNMTENNKKR